MEDLSLKKISFSTDYQYPWIGDKENKNTYYNLYELNISKSLLFDILKWNDDYQYIIPLNIEDRKKKHSEIELLDKRGLELAIRLQNELKEDFVIIYYFSEGTFSRIFL